MIELASLVIAVVVVCAFAIALIQITKYPKNVKGVVYWKNGEITKTMYTFDSYPDFEDWMGYMYRTKGSLISKITFEK